MGKRGRKPIDISRQDFEKLCGLQCRLDEIADFFDCSEDTIERWCQRTYHQKFADVFRIKRGKGRIALRRSQFELAKKSAVMSIWLGKQYLDQVDVQPEQDNPLDDPIMKLLGDIDEQCNVQ